jgi:hypothetical protein
MTGRHAPILQALRDPGRFSSKANRDIGRVAEAFVTDSMSSDDPPDHTRLRGPVRSGSSRGPWPTSRRHVDQATCPSIWTHVWEEEFASAAELNGEYAMNPYHWAGVDRWFDAEIPGAIVEWRLARA